MKIALDQIWVTPQSLIVRVCVWGQNGEWRAKRYASMPLEDIPEEVLTDLISYHLDSQPEEDHHQTALF